MKPSKHVDEATLRKIIQAMPERTAKIVREAAKKHGLLPGGDQPDKPEKKR